MSSSFTLPEVNAAIISEICQRMGFADGSFGVDGHDERFSALQEMGDMDVCACPGSGKTTLLVAKLGAIMSRWSALDKGVCVISHTNVARNEIGRRLGATPAGNKLLAHPHYVGTIHGFVNEFMAIPWLTANGYKVVTVDTEIARTKRLSSLYRTDRENLLRSNKEKVVEVISADLQLRPIKWGMGFLNPTTPTFKKIDRAVRKSIGDGVFSYSEMFVWANDFLDKRPEIAAILRSRFPMVFIDEAQDTTAEQLRLLNRIFKEGDSDVVVQRFGDGNQAIFSGDDDEGELLEELAFPQGAISRSLPKSHRFGQGIADLADPLGLEPYGMEGLGPVAISGNLLAEPAHTIFLFEDEEGARKVPDAFADLLSVTFSEQQLKEGLFKAVGQIHKKIEGTGFPRNVSHYCELYDPGASKNEANPRNLLEHILHGREKATSSGHAFPAVDGVATGLLRLFDLMDFKLPPALANRQNRHRKIAELLADQSEDLRSYREIVQLLGINRLKLSEQVWDDEVVPKFRALVEAICGPIGNHPLVGEFLRWNQLNVAAAIAPKSSSAGNTFSFPRNGVSIPIQFGSIHSVKGETHTATLVLETFFHSQNMASIAGWFTGEKSGEGRRCGVRDKDRLKLHYVAMTRPSHLVCLGIHTSTFVDKTNKEKGEVITLLESKGWRIQEV